MEMSFFHSKVELKDVGNNFVSLPSKWNLHNFATNQFVYIFSLHILLDLMFIYTFLEFDCVKDYISR